MTNSTPIKIAISGAAGNIGYALLPLLANGYVFQNQPVELRLLEIPHAIKTLSGTRMELLDCAFPCLTNVICTTDPLEAFQDANVIVLVGGFPRRKGMARKDLIQVNTKIFTSMGQAMNEVASPDVKVLVVANPANTNCLVALTEASRIPSKNFCALTTLDHQRAKFQIADRLGVQANRVKNVTIWGNHSETQYPDALTGGYYIGENGEKSSLKTLFANDLEWATNDFVSIVQNRGKSVIEARGNSSALSAAMAVANCLKTWLVTGTQEDETVSMAVYNDQGYYGVQAGIVFSFPCECKHGEWFVKEDLQLSEFAQEKLKVTESELVEELVSAQELIDISRKRNVSVVSASSSMASESAMPL
jgi:malate dehydrogenase